MGSHLHLLAQSRNQMEMAIGLTPSNMQISPLYQAELEDALQNYWLTKTALHPEEYYWYTNWEMILLSKNKSIGGIGIGGPPNEEGEAILGFIVDEAYQQQGFASEATLRMIDWYFEQPDAKALTATTYVDNIASTKTLERCGFQYHKTEEGLLHYYKRR